PRWRGNLRRVTVPLRRAAAALLPVLLLAYLTDWLLSGLLRNPSYLPFLDLSGESAHPALVNVPLLAGAYLLAFWAGGKLLRLLAHEPTRRAKAASALMTFGLGLCTALTIVPLVFILADLVNKGIGAINWEFFVNL